jgi:RimJ/RimL family protein N-acetyltransferase
MQRSWRTDADKLTFIACVNESTSTSTSASTSTSSTSSTINIVQARTADAPPNMIGDVNLFLTPSDAEPADLPNPIIGEIEIMIASAAHRGHGLGRAILLTFLWYVLSSLDAITAEYGSGKEGTSHVEYLRVKISADNARSIRLFESVGFAKISSEPNYFGEVELKWGMSKASRGEVEARMEEVPRVVEYRME